MGATEALQCPGGQVVSPQEVAGGRHQHSWWHKVVRQLRKDKVLCWDLSQPGMVL